jgi:hypothetical protein
MSTPRHDRRSWFRRFRRTALLVFAAVVPFVANIATNLLSPIVENRLKTVLDEGRYEPAVWFINGGLLLEGVISYVIEQRVPAEEARDAEVPYIQETVKLQIATERR